MISRTKDEMVHLSAGFRLSIDSVTKHDGKKRLQRDLFCSHGLQWLLDLPNIPLLESPTSKGAISVALGQTEYHQSQESDLEFDS